MFLNTDRATESENEVTRLEKEKKKKNLNCLLHVAQSVSSAVDLFKYLFDFGPRAAEQPAQSYMTNKSWLTVYLGTIKTVCH